MANVIATDTGGSAPSSVATDNGKRVTLTVGRSVIGWGVLSLFLIAGADVPATAELSSAFAWLIFVAVLLLYGPSALATLSTLTRGTNP